MNSYILLRCIHIFLAVQQILGLSKRFGEVFMTSEEWQTFGQPEVAIQIQKIFTKDNQKSYTWLGTGTLIKKPGYKNDPKYFSYVLTTAHNFLDENILEKTSDGKWVVSGNNIYRTKIVIAFPKQPLKKQIKTFLHLYAGSTNHILFHPKFIELDWIDTKNPKKYLATSYDVALIRLDRSVSNLGKYKEFEGKELEFKPAEAGPIGQQLAAFGFGNNIEDFQRSRGSTNLDSIDIDFCNNPPNDISVICKHGVNDLQWSSDSEFPADKILCTNLTNAPSFPGTSGAGIYCKTSSNEFKLCAMHVRGTCGKSHCKVKKHGGKAYGMEIRLAHKDVASWIDEAISVTVLTTN